MSDSALCRSQSRIRLTERSVEYSRAFGGLTVDTGIDVPRSTALILEPSGSFEDIHGVADPDDAPARPQAAVLRPAVTRESRRLWDRPEVPITRWSSMTAVDPFGGV